jgi:hypothetical protein
VKVGAKESLLRVMLDDLIPADHVCRVIDAFGERLAWKNSDSSPGGASEAVL